MSRLYLAADDLTGALDSAACFCGRFGPIPVFLGPGHEPGSKHAAVDLATRDEDAAFAVQATSRVLKRLAGADVAFKKIDSLLRGHWAVELAELIRSGYFPICIFAPAFPSQGRTTHNGRQIVHAADGSSATLDIDPGAVLRRLGLSVLHVAAPVEVQLSALAEARPQVLLFDAAGNAELDAIVRWGAQLEQPVLWCGSAGLAQALAQRPTPRATQVQAPLLVIVGTDHAVTADQVARALAAAPERHVVAGSDSRDTAARIALAFEATGTCLLSFEVPAGSTAADAATSIDQRLRQLLPVAPRPATLLVTGGATLLSVCGALGAQHLEVDAEFSPGIPRSRLCGGVWNGLAVISKSGAFGHPAMFDELLAAAR